ncbi:hypothetical protein ACTA71_000156 [Dictyostelium dimigraforme]
MSIDIKFTINDILLNQESIQKEYKYTCPIYYSKYSGNYVSSPYFLLFSNRYDISINHEDNYFIVQLNGINIKESANLECTFKIVNCIDKSKLIIKNTTSRFKTKTDNVGCTLINSELINMDKGWLRDDQLTIKINIFINNNNRK